MEESDHHEIYVSCRYQLKMGAKTEVNGHEREFIFLDHEHRDTHPPFNKRIAQVQLLQYLSMHVWPKCPFLKESSIVMHVTCTIPTISSPTQNIHMLAKHFVSL